MKYCEFINYEINKKLNKKSEDKWIVIVKQPGQLTKLFGKEDYVKKYVVQYFMCTFTRFLQNNVKDDITGQWTHDIELDNKNYHVRFEIVVVHNMKILTIKNVERY